MIFLLRGGFMVGSLARELMGLYFLYKLINYFEKDDAFTSTYLRNVQTPYPHPLQAIHLALITNVIKISIHTYCVFLLLEPRSLRKSEPTNDTSTWLFVTTTYQIWCSFVPLLSCFASYIWSKVFHSTLRNIISCTLSANCIQNMNIITS